MEVTAANRNLPAVVQPKVVLSPHPLSALADRRLVYCPFETGESIEAYLMRNNIYPVRINDFVLSINDVRVHPRNWARVYPTNGDLITLRANVHGGGNGDENKTLRTVLTIAVLAAAGPAGIGGWAAVSGLGVFGPAVVSLGGMLLINALLPVKIPEIDKSQTSPNYSLSGSANQARLFGPLPLVFGVHRMYPDHGAKPFTYFKGQDQYMVQVFNFGLSDITIADMKIGDTVLTSFDDYSIEESAGTTGVLKSFPGNVDTIAGGDLIANVGTFIQKTSSLNTTKLGVDISGLNYFIGREEGLTFARIFVTIEYRLVGDTTWLPFVGATAKFKIVNGDKEIMRKGYTKNVTEGQYEVRVMLDDSADIEYNRTDCDDEGENCTTSKVYSARGLNNGGMTQVLQWEQLKSFQPDTASYTGQKRLALSIKASGQLNGRIDAFNCIVSAQIPVWTGSAWVTQITSNPAWQYLALARGGFSGTQRLWGAGLPDARIDIDQIKLWGAWCDSKGLTCNIIFDSKLNVDAMLGTIARCGRAAATWASGKLGVIYDEANKPVVAVFGMSNIIRNTFKVNYITGKLVDEVIIAFTNPDIGYQRDTVSALVPGVTNPINSVTIELRGVTSKVQAGKEALLIAAEQFYRRRQISWESDIEGLAVQRGDVAILAHDLTQWDYSGRLEAGTTTVLTLDRDVPFTPGTQHYVGIRYPGGSYNVYDVAFAGTPNLIIFPEELDNAAWTNIGISVLPNSYNAPDGTYTADLVTGDGIAIFPKARQNVTTWSAGLKTLTSARFVKNIDLDYTILFLRNNTSGDAVGVKFKFNSGVPEYDTGINIVNCVLESYSVAAVGDGWYRLSMTASFNTPFGVNDLLECDQHLSWNVATTKSAYFWGAALTESATLLPYKNEQSVITLTTPLPSAPDTDPDNIPMDYLWFFAPKPTPGKQIKITDVQPLSQNRVRITATDEDDNYYLAENNSYTYITPGTFTPDIPTISDLQIGESLIVVGAGFGSRVNLSWNISGEYGGATIRAKDEDKGYIEIGRTLDRRFDFEWPTGKTVTVEVWAFNLKGQRGNSGKATASLLLVGKKKVPDNVTGFIAIQNGQAAVIKWDQPADIDLSGTEVRYGPRGNSTWEDATPLTVVTKGTNITSQDLPDGDHTLFAKHKDTSLNYSAMAAQSDLVFSSDNDIIDQVEQAPDWPGTLTNFVKHHTGVLVPSSQGDTIALGWRVFDEFVPDPYTICTYEASEMDIGFDDTVRISGDIQSALRGLTGGVANPKLSIDYKKNADAYDGFEDWSIGNALCQQVKHKLTLDTTVGVAIISGFNPTVDLKERTDKEQFTVAAGGSTVTFAKSFHRPPFASADINSVASGTAAFATVTNVTTTTADVNCYNLSNTDAGGVATLALTGV